MKTVIAGTDFSATSINACKYAAFLAQKLNCKLILFNLFESPIIHSNVGLYGISFAEERNTSSHKIAKLTTELRKQFPKIKIEHFVTFGNLKKELKDFTKAHKVEVAVLGLSTKNKISKFIFGTRGLNVAGKIDCPVIIVPSSYKFHKLSKVILAVDSNEKLLKSPLIGFEKFIKESGAKLNLLHVKTADEIFNPLKTTLTINRQTLPINVINSVDIQTGIKKHCSFNHADLVAIISKKHSVFYDFFLESTTKKVAFASKVPVMAIHE